jgi:hypothetical protein
MDRKETGWQNVKLIHLALNRASLLRCDTILYSSTLMICLVASAKTSVHLWEFTQLHIPEGSHPEASDHTEYRQEVLCTKRSLCCSTALMSSVDGHYKQTFTEVANSAREDGHIAVSAGT